jgi:uncharacterized membrane protein
MASRHGRNRLRALWDAIRNSLWPIPALMGLAAALLEPVATWIDGRLGSGPDESFPRLIYVSEPDQAREILATILTSMITMASLVFSITMVVLTLAASQFGPRLIRNFMGSRQTQLVLGAFVLTIVYCLLLLASVGWREGEGPFPYLSVTVAIALALLSVGLLVYYLHALATSIMSETLIEAVGEELDQGIGELRPLDQGDDPEAVLPEDFEIEAHFSAPGTAGYVQAIEFRDIVEAARSADALVGLHFRAGDFVTETGKDIGIYPSGKATPELARAVTQAISVGVHRTPVQDPEFSIRHLVEIAVRALSPGINDPYTAVAAIDRLSASLARLMAKALPQGVFRDPRGTVRVICPRATYATLLSASFDQIRQNGADKPLILIHLLEAIVRIGRCARTEEQRVALREQVRTIAADAEREVANADDLSDVRRQVQRVEEVLRSAAEPQAT